MKAIGGYDEVGRNMTALRVGKKIIILDVGLYLDRVQVHEETYIERMHSLDLIEIGAIPDDTVLNSMEGEIVGIVCSHGHLDHIGAIKKLAHRYDAPIITTPFTAEILRRDIGSEKKFNVQNPINELEAGQRYLLSSDIELEFIRTQHSIPDCVLPVIHTPKGSVFYGLDFKLDRNPVLGDETNVERLKELGNEEDVILSIMDSTRIEIEGKTPSESVARKLVMDTLYETENEDNGIFVTTFSSHVARIKSITEAAVEMGRKPVLIGRSMERYAGVAEEMGILDLPKEASIYGTPNGRKHILEKVKREGRENYLLVVTGHQGEPGATLTRIADGELPIKILDGDQIVFSANVIPNPLTRANRYSLETKLKMQGARLFKDVHVSGHASRQDHYDLINMISPEHIIPAHGDLSMNCSYVELAEDLGYRLSEDVHILRNGQELIVE